MKVEISHAEMRERYPEELAQLVRKLRSSSSRERYAPEDGLSYALGWAIGFNPMSPQDVRQALSGQAPRKTEPPYGQTPPEGITMAMVRDVVSPSIAWSLQASRGRWSAGVRGNPAAIPDEIISVMRDAAVRDQERRMAFQDMTPQQRQGLADDALRQLSGSPGFVVIRPGR